MPWFGMTVRILYSGLALDRAQTVRRRADITELARMPSARFAPYWRGLQLIGGNPPAALWAGADIALPLLDSLDATCLLLGMDDRGPLLALDLSRLDAGEGGPALGPDLAGKWVMLRSVGGQLPAEDAALLAYARGMLVWRDRTRYCSVCGAALAFDDAGHSAKCVSESCAALHFPRTDAAIIVLVTDRSDRALLGRQPVWQPGMYSCLAGFVEPGESLEEAVAREVFEESGIRITSASYVASQPWPFPSSLMLGFTARAEGGEPVADPHEIEEVRWWSRDEVRRFGEADAPGPDGHFLPRRDSISRFLVDRWLRGGD